MKIVNARVDERLIHGQVAMVWTNTLKADRIIVVNDEVIKDDMMIAAMKIAKPAGVKLSLLSTVRAPIRLSDGSYEGENVFIITKNIEDMNYLVKNAGLEHINIGNVSGKENSKQIKKSVSLTDKEIKLLEELVESGTKVTAQMLPTEPDDSILSFL